MISSRPRDLLTLTVFFPDAGATATGHVFRFGFDGKRASPPESGTSRFAQQLVDVGVQRKDNALTLEVAIPARALPRFPAEEPLVFDLCLTYEDVDAAGATPPAVSNCKDGGMLGEALRLPDDFRKGLKLKPPKGVVALEGQADGWLGYGILHYPDWVEADEPLTPELLEVLVAPNVGEGGVGRGECPGDALAAEWKAPADGVVGRESLHRPGHVRLGQGIAPRPLPGEGEDGAAGARMAGRYLCAGTSHLGGAR